MIPSGQYSKNAILLILQEILKTKTDAAHRLKKSEIKKILKSEYGLEVAEKTILNNLRILMLTEKGLCCEEGEVNRTTSDGARVAVCTNWYMEQEFDNSELRFLIDGLLFSKFLRPTQCKALIEKLKGLTSQYFSASVRHIFHLPQETLPKVHIFSTIDLLDEAIERGVQVAFSFMYYKTDKKLHRVREKDGKIKTYSVSPYQMVAANGLYYLICGHVGNKTYHYRLDKIADMELLEVPAQAPPQAFNLATYMAEHIYLYSGESERVCFRANVGLINTIVDLFGKNASFENENEKTVDAVVKVNMNAFEKWAVQFCEQVEVLSPAALRNRVAAILQQALLRYGVNPEKESLSKNRGM